MSTTSTFAGTIRSGTRCVSLDELAGRAARAATGFVRTRVTEGGAVAVLLRNDVPFLECMLGSSMAGGYCVPINWHYKTEEVRYILTDSGASHLVVHSDLLRTIADAIPETVVVLVVATPPEIRDAYRIKPENAFPRFGDTDWDSWVLQWPARKEESTAALGSMTYTAGTTGRPKAVKRQPIGSNEREAYARLRAEWFGHRPGMRTAITGPLYHSVQATYTYSALRTGGHITLVPKFDAEGLLRIIDAERLTHLHLVPTMMHRLVELPESIRRQYDVSSLEFVIHGAAPCAPSIKRRLIDWWGPIVHEYYGTSEAGMVSRSSSEEWLQREGTVGKPWPGRSVRILDEDGRALPPRHKGLIYMSLGPVPDFTYHHAERLRSEIERDGLITAGDIGYVDENEYLYLCDRKQDVVISGGVNIWPAEVEAVLSSHPAVGDCAVFGIPDDEFGEVPAAAVQPVDGRPMSADELKAFLSERLAQFKVPRRFEFCDSLPRDDSGKILKRLLRQRHWSAAGRHI